MSEFIKIPSGHYLVGTNSQEGFEKDKEGPQVLVWMNEFKMSTTPITNEEFNRFIEATGYVTEAEKFGWSYVFHYFLSMEEKIKAQEMSGLNWWLAVEGADWNHPEGANSSIEDRWNHPVVHVSRNDALAYCEFTGSRLPTEIEWEIAAKGGTTNERYPWGDAFLIDGQHQCNIWQGEFPLTNTLEDGYDKTAPVKSYLPNNYGLYQMVGNIWEWCLNPQGIDLDVFQKRDSLYFLKNYQSIDDQSYALKGGSFLCHESYCKRYRIAARNGNTGSSTSNNMGFRCVNDKYIKKI